VTPATEPAPEALRDRFSVICRILSIYQRQRVWDIKSAFNRLKDFRRIATRYDRLALNYLASVCLAAALVWWI
jgi:transposase